MYLTGLEVHIVVSDLEVDPDEVSEWDVVSGQEVRMDSGDAVGMGLHAWLDGAESHHEFDCYAEEATGFCISPGINVSGRYSGNGLCKGRGHTVVNHIDVLCLCWTIQCVPPEQI